jgi:hypothetical protein
VFFGEKQTGRENVAKTSREGGRREERREKRKEGAKTVAQGGKKSMQKRLKT